MVNQNQKGPCAIEQRRRIRDTAKEITYQPVWASVILLHTDFEGFQPGICWPSLKIQVDIGMLQDLSFVTHTKTLISSQNQWVWTVVDTEKVI